MFEFIEYVSTPNEKHFGIVKVKAYNKIVLRYKIMPKKDGSGVFPVCASYKVSDSEGDKYVSAFVIDSNSDKEEIESLIRQNVKKYINSALSQPYTPIPAQSKFEESQKSIAQENEEIPF